MHIEILAGAFLVVIRLGCVSFVQFVIRVHKICKKIFNIWFAVVRRGTEPYQLVVRVRFHLFVPHPLDAGTGFGRTAENLLRENNII